MCITSILFSITLINATSKVATEDGEGYIGNGSI